MHAYGLSVPPYFSAHFFVLSFFSCALSSSSALSSHVVSHQPKPNQSIAAFVLSHSNPTPSFLRLSTLHLPFLTLTHTRSTHTHTHTHTHILPLLLLLLLRSFACTFHPVLRAIKHAVPLTHMSIFLIHLPFHRHTHTLHAHPPGTHHHQIQRQSREATVPPSPLHVSPSCPAYWPSGNLGRRTSAAPHPRARFLPCVMRFLPCVMRLDFFVVPSVDSNVTTSTVRVPSHDSTSLSSLLFTPPPTSTTALKGVHA
ncbi:hypothetical protein PTSG_10858 [Salpingoeca rosetta]|uniref:Secreted protein n=1 Tax=Salpingoeca rosetta (strain ATCC 50818 / BSB-021) TaxID=946362 RepID=F2URK8_SALR5|nr:uncharacterized protein PTSG_10858 [Salpingoeca rosetta]EGD80177.1 hypothetical protein PTSG_10858 [Salpingoeca rosetta]|eukprot:XP_004988239.1 hypothetical protein PTSG_10858 [Salpingoeca rosetta]